MYVCSLWELNWVMHKEPMVALLAWQHALPNKCYKVMWKMAFFAIIWSIWLLRNDLVFNGKVFDFQQTIDIVKFRIASWFKAKWPNCPNTLLDVVRFPNTIQVSVAAKNVKKVSLWSTPPLGVLKFNVDGSARGKPGPAGIGGVLRDCSGVVKAVFSKAIGVTDSNVAELLAVREALRIFTDSSWVSSHKLTIESDSSNVVNWVLNYKGTP